MKRTFLFLTVTIAMVMGVKAQQQTATLQQGATTKVYYGQDAFKDAYNNAQNGAKITLSSGVFTQVDSITKSITIIGNGGFPVGERTYFNTVYRKNENFPGFTATSIASEMLINANNVSVESIYMDDAVILRNISGLHLTRCYIGQLFCTGVHTNTIIDQCYVKLDGADWIGQSGVDARSVNCCIKNSFVEGFLHNRHLGACYLSETLTILNSVVFRSYYFDRNFDVVQIYPSKSTIRNSILGLLYLSTLDGNKTDENHWNGYRTYVQSVGSYNLWFLYPYHYTASDSDQYDDSAYELIDYLKSHAPSGGDNGNTGAAYDAIFNEDVPWYDPNYIKTTVTGDDGTVVGPYGGTGFSLYPSIPRITESKIDTYTNGEGKLNVKVKVEVGQ